MQLPTIQGLDLTSAIGKFREWFFYLSQLLFNIKFSVAGINFSLGALLVTGIFISFILSVFWKGGKQ